MTKLAIRKIRRNKLRRLAYKRHLTQQKLNIFLTQNTNAPLKTYAFKKHVGLSKAKYKKAFNSQKVKQEKGKSFKKQFGVTKKEFKQMISIKESIYGVDVKFKAWEILKATDTTKKALLQTAREERAFNESPSLKVRYRKDANGKTEKYSNIIMRSELEQELMSGRIIQINNRLYFEIATGEYISESEVVEDWI